MTGVSVAAVFTDSSATRRATPHARVRTRHVVARSAASRRIAMQSVRACACVRVRARMRVPFDARACVLVRVCLRLRISAFACLVCMCVWMRACVRARAGLWRFGGRGAARRSAEQ
eukprot:2392460-Pleurochrysis_carterae.AAC.2